MFPIYIFSGLGADSRAFKNLQELGREIIFIEWIAPQKNELIENYATRLLQQIPTPNPILIGLSFGGMIAIEVGKQIPTSKIIVLASAKTKHELPRYFKLMHALRAEALLHIAPLSKPYFILNWLFGVHTISDKKLLKQIIKETNQRFLMWAINKVLTWNNEIIPSNVVHVHGTTDKLMPIRKIRCDVRLEGAGHFMTITNHEQIIDILIKHVGIL